MASTAPGPSQPRPIILVHGGAADYDQSVGEARLIGVQRAAKQAWLLLTGGCSTAVDAVQGAVRVLEDWPPLNAGTGSNLTISGDVEMDAVIMDGLRMKAGGVTCVKNIKNPINLARAVLDKTDHVLLAGEGANEFASKLGIPTVPPHSLLSEYSKKQWEQYKQYKHVVHNFFSPADVCDAAVSHDTVGAVALDSTGNLAAATSTGGITAKMSGRVGDSPIIGSGCYADNNTCAISTTGHGESIMRICLAKHISMLTQLTDQSLSEACKSGISYLKSKVDGGGGVIGISSSGEYAYDFNTKRMPWAVCSDREKFYGLNPHECHALNLDDVATAVDTV